MRATTFPRFTIILPSYNGGEYLKLSVNSVLQQTFPDFELVILDDASTDGSFDWLRSLSNPRVKLFPSNRNLGIADNWRRALEIPKGEFMTVLGQDDLLDSDFLANIDELIRAQPDASLYHAHFRFIDEQGELISSARPMPERENAAQYVRALFNGRRDTYATGYVFRSALHDELGGFPPYPNLFFADDAFWIKAMSCSYKATTAQECFSCRRHQNSLSASGSQWRAWIEAMPLYANFLVTKASEYPGLKEALDETAFSYFLHYCRVKYLDGLVQETKANRRIDPQLLQEMDDMLSAFQSNHQRAVNDGFAYKLREFINRYYFTRSLYNFYVDMQRKEQAP